MNTEDLLKDLYKLGNKEVKDKLLLEHPTLFKTKLLIDEAIESLGESDEDVIKLGKLLSILDDNDRLVAEQKLIIVIKYKNLKRCVTKIYIVICNKFITSHS